MNCQHERTQLLSPSIRKRLAGFCLLALVQLAPLARGQVRRNVLFIAADDLRPELGIYGTRAFTPHIDRLAARGLTFDRAYCQYSLCNPSRASLLTGRRTDSIGIRDLGTSIRAAMLDAITLPQHFKDNGYFAQGIGKVFHNGLNDSRSWSVPHVAPRYDFFTGPSWKVATVPEDELPDARTARLAVEALRERSNSTEPFFLAVGFIRPHLPFVAPQRYFDLYPPETIELPRDGIRPRGAPNSALSNGGELESYPNASASPSPSEARDLKRAYLAAVSFVDAQVGRLIAALEDLDLTESTIVVFWGDHGFHLGEQALWGKFTNFETGARVPLVISVPGRTNAGLRTNALAELVDVFPTLCELTGLPLPRGLEGTSLVPLLEDPDRPWKRAVFHQRGFTRDDTGYSIRTDRYRYTEWLRAGRPTWRELYDYQEDPGETLNLAGDPDHEGLVAQLSRRLNAGWRDALPPTPGSFRRGDCNDDGAVDLSDAVSTLSSLFLGEEDPACDDACDTNDDGAVDASDPVATLGVLFLGNGVIPLPGMTRCGVDPTEDQIDCDIFRRCP